MQHEEVVNALEEIVPDIAKSGDPEGTILKYAKDQNLSPSQVERLGQVFNIAKTVNFMSKSADNRGGSFNVVDTVDLLSSYMSSEDEKVQKSATSIDDWIDTPQEAGVSSVPDFLALASGANSEVDWVVEDVPDLPKIASEIYAEAKKETIGVWERESVDEIVDGIKDDIRNKFDKVAQDLDLFAQPERFAIMEEDLSSLIPNGDAACSAMADYLSQKGLNIKRASENTVSRKLVHDRLGVSESFRGIVEDFEFIKAAGTVIKESAAAGTGTGTGTGSQKKTNWEKIDMLLTGGGEKKEPSSAPDISDFLKDISTSREKSDEEKSEKDYHPSMVKKIETMIAGTPPDKKKGISGGVADLLGKASPTEAGKLLGTLSKGLDKAKSPLNKKKMQRDQAEDDVKSTTTLQKLLISDPIISEADPDEVVEIYNTLSSGFPQMGQDPNLMRFAIREALQYGGVPLHTFKDLSSIRKEQAQAQKDEITSTENRYRN